jgi:hypothetical protein
MKSACCSLIDFSCHMNRFILHIYENIFLLHAGNLQKVCRIFSIHLKMYKILVFCFHFAKLYAKYITFCKILSLFFVKFIIRMVINTKLETCAECRNQNVQIRINGEPLASQLC